MENNANTLVISPKLATWQDYLALCKPKVVLMILITAMVGMYLASVQSFDIKLMFIANIAIGFAASAAAVINHVVDVNIDAKMQRTQWRPLVKQRISSKQALIFATALAFSSMFLLLKYVNVLTALLTLVGFIGYAVIYTCFLKHKTPQNIVYGGFAGAIPPLLGWTSITNSIDLEPLLLTLIIFLWTPAHFWPLAIDRIEDYRQANVPMLPVVKGVDYTKTCVLIYTIATIIASLLPYFFHYSGEVYLCLVLVLGLWFGYFAIQLKITVKNQLALKTFRISIYYLIALFLALLLDRLIVHW
ncbi:protoheme IX farnesyltransferase [Colwellia psychrerythraea]|uniref:Protoheme IX farnesyltransferase n=1 Tax=Colwellia psychrerythraea TaxID=28229 RepID=A0A1Y5EP50_COLPS|nr:protoheme IX farnesyltransferase [Colwellia psychrerythraea]